MRGLFDDIKGAAAIEFAIASTALMLLVFGITELGRMLWIQQALQAAAAETARCVAIGSIKCPDGGAFAASAAADRGVSDVDSTLVTVTDSDPCGSAAGNFTKVVIAYPYASVVPSFVPAPAGGLTATGCFPH